MSERVQYFIFITHASQQIYAISHAIADFCYSTHILSSFSFSEYSYFIKGKSLPLKKPAPAGHQELLTNIRSLVERNISTVLFDFYWNNDPDFDISLLLPTTDKNRILLISANSNFFIPENKLEAQVIAFIRQLWLYLKPYYGYGIVHVLTEYPRDEDVKRLDHGHIDTVRGLNLFSNAFLDTHRDLYMKNIPETNREFLDDGSVLLLPGTLLYYENDETDQNIEHISRTFKIR